MRFSIEFLILTSLAIDLYLANQRTGGSFAFSLSGVSFASSFRVTEVFPAALSLFVIAYHL